MIQRTEQIRLILGRLRHNRVVGILGPRQVGKTTLAGQVGAAFGRPVRRFDLEDVTDLRRLEHPMEALEGLRGLVILDEVQHRPEIFPALRVLADRRPLPARFLVLGSAAPALLRQSSESLAGRITYHELGGFDIGEVRERGHDRLWLRGGFPPSFLATSEARSVSWRTELVRTYLQRDLPALGMPAAPETLRRLWAMIAHVHGQTWNSSDISRSLGASDKTVRRYLDFLASTFLVRLLPPWHENLAKRQVKAPKVYFRDSGLLHALLGIRTREGLLDHPRMGASWEGFALEQALHFTAADPWDAFFWRTQQGAELDLLIVRGRERLGFEFKRARSPGMTPSMRIAIQDLRLTRLLVVHAGPERYSLGKQVEAVPLAGLAEVL